MDVIPRTAQLPGKISGNKRIVRVSKFMRAVFDKGQKTFTQDSSTHQLREHMTSEMQRHLPTHSEDQQG